MKAYIRVKEVIHIPWVNCYICGVLEYVKRHRHVCRDCLRKIADIVGHSITIQDAIAYADGVNVGGDDPKRR